MNSWKTLLEEEMEIRGDTMLDVVSTTLTEADMEEEFDDGYGIICGKPFTVWTATTVYFPLCYDGAERVGSASRNPDGKPTPHQGGG